MKRTFLSVLSLILALLLLAPVLVACNGGNQGDDGSDTTSNQSDGTTSGTETEPGDDSESESETDNGNNVGPEIDKGVGPFADSIAYANKVANGVQTYYTTADRETYTINNMNMTLEYNLSNNSPVLVNSIKNPAGASYIENTMDTFVKLTDGTVIYGSDSPRDARSNVYRIGYYYYDVHFLDHSFIGDYNVDKSLDVDLGEFSSYSKDVKGTKVSGGEMRILIGGSGDPYIVMGGGADAFKFSASEYNAIQFTIKSDKANAAQVYYIAGGATNQTNDQSVKFDIINDGEYHTYTVALSEGKDYSGEVSRIRLDFDNAAAGDVIYLKDVKVVNAKATGPSLYLDRTFHTYSDKLHHELHFVATKLVDNVSEVGMITKVAVDTVDKIIVKDANSTHDSLEGVDWATAEYIGFDIKNVGIFGYILPVHKNTGKMTVEVVDGNYVITQTSAPGTIQPAVSDTSNDYNMGQRIYTDANHTFDAFVAEAEYERNPLATLKSDSYIGYDALNGAYEFTISGTGFNAPFLYEWHKHHIVEAMFRGGNTDRSIYVRTVSSAGCLENAVLLDGNDLVLPIPMEVSKNFGSENEEPLFYTGDTSYSETVFPLYLTANTKLDLTVINLYQNWGRFPLKQLSSIQYFWPYYHLSVGTTETSCISPWYGARDLWTLPDFRSQSMPYWWDLEEDKGYSNQPQHTHGGYQYFLQYTDANGNHYATENISNVIDSSGPIYADVDMTYISDDGKIKVTYKHLEMPQMDELRAYYSISYEILDEVTIKDFAKDFSFYSFEGYAGYYRNMGYWAENGDEDAVVHKATNGTAEPEMLVLGNESPYVALYNLYSSSPTWSVNNVNLGFVLYDSEIVIGGEKKDDNFVVVGSNYIYSLSMDLGEVTLKPGDTLNLDMIISPWGWTTSTDDKNMQDIRENTCLDPLTVEVTDGKKIDSPFLPRVLSTNGESAEFTLSGGTSNVAVRVYGFKTFTAPKIYELVEGNWVEYAVNSIEAPDKLGNKHYYDGFYVYYDEDGTFSYSFAVNMDEVESRTFKIVANEEFKSWPEGDHSGEFDGPLDVFVGPDDLFIFSENAHGLNEREAVNEDVSFVRFHGGSDQGEVYFTAFNNGSGEISPTGQYAIVKYRLPSTNSVRSSFQIFSSTNQKGATGNSDNTSVASSALRYDNNWNIFVIDLSKNIGDFKPDSSDSYTAFYARLDIFNNVMPATDFIDIAYFAMTDDLNDLCEYENFEGTADVISGSVITGTLHFNDGSITDGAINSEPAPEIPSQFIDPENEQGYTKSNTSYVSSIDFINGLGDDDPTTPAYDNYRSHEVIGPKVVNFNGATVGNAYLAVAGWTIVYEGIEKYVWSADGGKTWNDIVLYPETKKLSAAVGGIKNAGDGHFGQTIPGFDKDAYNQDYYADSAYQGAANTPMGIAAHLKDYIGQEVDVTFAVVPKNDPDGLCVINHIQNVRVYASDEDAKAGEACKHLTATKYVFIDDGNNSTDAAKISATCDCGEVSFGEIDPKYVFFFDKIGETATAPLVCENSKGFVTINAPSFIVSNNTKSFTAAADGSLYMKGWAGANGGIGKVVYKVYDESGAELTNGWTDTAATLTIRSDIAGEMTKREIEASNGRGYDFTLNLSEQFAKSGTLKIVLAIESASASEEINDRYIYLCEMCEVVKAS